MSKRETYCRADVAGEVAARFQVSHALASEIVDFSIEAIQAALEAGLRVEFRTFGTFEFRRRRARVGRNPLYPERGEVEIPERTEIVFRPSKELAQKVKDL